MESISDKHIEIARRSLAQRLKVNQANAVGLGERAMVAFASQADNNRDALQVQLEEILEELLLFNAESFIWISNHLYQVQSNLQRSQRSLDTRPMHNIAEFLQTKRDEIADTNFEPFGLLMEYKPDEQPRVKVDEENLSKKLREIVPPPPPPTEKTLIAMVKNEQNWKTAFLILLIGVNVASHILEIIEFTQRKNVSGLAQALFYLKQSYEFQNLFIRFDLSRLVVIGFARLINRFRSDN